MNSILCKLFITCVVNLQTVTPLDELSYGTVLYEYYQEQYEEGMVQVLVAEAQGRTGSRPERFKIAGGSFSFAMGMFDHAQKTFEELDAGELSDLDKQRLAFHLARESFRRQDWKNLGSHLATINLDRSWVGRPLVHPEVEFMRAELAIHNKQLSKARVILDTIPEDSSMRTYGLFNLGVAYYQSAENTPANFEGASEIYELLSQMPAHDEETLDIVQRSRLALARLKTEASERHASMSETEPSKSLLDELSSILPGSGRYRNLALASFANMAMRDQDPQTASRIWQMLKKETNWTASSANAYLGLPMSLELLSNNGTVTHAVVLQEFKEAEKRFELRLDTLQRISLQANDTAWMSKFLTVIANTQNVNVQQGHTLEQWQKKIGYADWLEWLSSEAVHGLLSDWSELRNMQVFLDTIPDNLEALDAASTEINRRTSAANHLLLQEQGIANKHKLLLDMIEHVRSQIVTLEFAQVEYSEPWMLSIASDKQTSYVHRLSRMNKYAMQAFTKEDRLKLGLRVERLEGLLFFELVESKSTRLQTLRKELKSISSQMTAVEESQARLIEAEENYDTGLAISFDNFQMRADSLDKSVAKALQNRQELLAEELRSGMQRETKRVKHFLLVARLAIARTTDLLAMRSEHNSISSGEES